MIVNKTKRDIILVLCGNCDCVVVPILSNVANFHLNCNLKYGGGGVLRTAVHATTPDACFDQMELINRHETPDICSQPFPHTSDILPQIL